MTTRKEQNYELGQLILEYREKLTDLPKSRQEFINERSRTYFNNEEWISEKTLANYENGRNIPSLENIPKLALALEIDPLELVSEILKVI